MWLNASQLFPRSEQHPRPCCVQGAGFVMQQSYPKRFVPNKEEADFAWRFLPSLLLWIDYPQPAFNGEVAHARQRRKIHFWIAHKPKCDWQHLCRIFLEPRAGRKGADRFGIAARPV